MTEQNDKQIWITPEAHQKIKIAAAKRGMTMKEFLEEQYGEENDDKE